MTFLKRRPKKKPAPRRKILPIKELVIRKKRKPKPEPIVSDKPEPIPELVIKPELTVEPKPKKLLVGDVSDRITVVTVNFKTPDLVQDAVESFLTFYPKTPYILIDNGGCLESLSVCIELSRKHKSVTFIANSRNIGHGPALNQGLSLVKTPYALLLDSDTKTEYGGFLEKMLVEFNENVFAVGWLRYVNKSGVAHRIGGAGIGIPYIHPYACLLDVDKFHSLCPFLDTNAPAISLMKKACTEGLEVISFPVKDYIWHKVAGTRGLFRGNCHPDTDAQPGTWHRRSI